MLVAGEIRSCSSSPRAPRTPWTAPSKSTKSRLQQPTVSNYSEPPPQPAPSLRGPLPQSPLPSAPRIQQLRKLTARRWGLEERQLCAVASGYVRGVLVHAAATWLLVTPQSHVELLQREMRAVTRISPAAPCLPPAHAVMAEAGLTPVPAGRPARRAGSEALRQGARAPRGQALRTIAEDGPPSRLKSVTGWRGGGHETWRAAGIISDSCSCRQSRVTSVCGARVQDGGRR